jgi:protoporphyrinogen IX oxidase
MLAIKSLHIIFMVAWYAGLFYLPRLFVYHSMATDSVGIERFKVMERRLYRGIMTPSAILTVVFGTWLWLGYGFTGGWLHAKLALVVILIAFHVWLGKLVADFAADRNTHGDKFYRWINEIPALPILIGVVFLVVMKPF